jgi:hypothetical protein
VFWAGPRRQAIGQSARRLIWTRVSRQLVNSSFSPLNSIATAPTAKATGGLGLTLFYNPAIDDL